MGISVDHIYAHNVFAASLGGLPFPLLADWSRKVTRQYGVFDEELERPRRSIFVLDKDGVVRHKNTSYDIRSPRHYQEILDALAKI